MRDGCCPVVVARWSQGWRKWFGRSGFGWTTFLLKQKKKFLVGFDQCFMAWQRKSWKYSNNATTHYSVPVTTDHLWNRPQVWHCSAGMRWRLGRGSMTSVPKCTRIDLRTSKISWGSMPPDPPSRCAWNRALFSLLWLSGHDTGCSRQGPLIGSIRDDYWLLLFSSSINVSLFFSWSKKF